MSTLSASSILEHGHVKDNFDETFVKKMVKVLPTIMSMDSDDLTYSKISKKVKLPRPQVGQFLQELSDMKGWPIAVVGRRPVIKDGSDETIEVSTEEQSSSADENARVAKEIIKILQMPPIDDVIGVTYASIPHLAEETNASTEFVEDVVKYLIDKGIVSRFDGENDFEEEMFTLNQDKLNEGKKAAKNKVATKKASPKEPIKEVKAPTEKPKAEPVKAEPVKTEPVKEVSENKSVEEPKEAFAKRTLEAVRRALKEDKYTRNGILKKVAKKGVHKRHEVLAAFEYLIEKGMATLTNDGGAREYYTITSTSKPKAQEEVKAVSESTTVETTSNEVVTENVTKEEKPAAKADTVEEDEVVVEPTASKNTGIKGLLEDTFLELAAMVRDSDESTASLENLSKKLKSAEYLIEAAKVLK